MVSVYGAWWYWRRFGADFDRLAEEYKTRERWTREQFTALQSLRLQRVLQAAWSSRYYRQVFTEAAYRFDTHAS
jgi:hypothetical protein